MTKRFSFGKNWIRYVKHIVNDDTINDAIESFRRYQIDVKDKIIMDVGCGSGLFTVAFSLMGAKKVIAFDYDIKSIEATSILIHRYANLIANNAIELFQGDILDVMLINALRGKGDIVYSWGVLHHTGNMWRAIENTTDLVANEGKLILAIYNHAPSSFFWLKIKKLYNAAPFAIKLLMIFLYGGFVTFDHISHRQKLDLRRERGMYVLTDVIDWLGGFPYEFACFKDVKEFVEKRGFKLIHSPTVIECGKSEKPSLRNIIFGTNTGCNEFVFKKL